MRPRAPRGVCSEISFYDFPPFPFVVNISLLIVEPYGCLAPTADVRIKYLPQRLGLPRMAEELLYLQQVYLDLSGFISGSVLTIRAAFYIPCS